MERHLRAYDLSRLMLLACRLTATFVPRIDGATKGKTTVVAKDITLKNEQMEVVLDGQYPRVIEYRVAGTTAYGYRSSLGASLVSGWDVRKPNLDYKLFRRLEAEFWRVAPYFLEDYYPLTDYDPSPAAWMAWQFDRPEQGDGVVQAFRRDKSEEPTKHLRLRGLDPAATYEVTDLDTGKPQTIAGSELMQQGLPVEIKGKPGAAIISYRKTK